MTPKPDDLIDPRIANAWRESSNEEPAASVDAAILAAARREVSARPEALVEWQAREARASRRRWWPLAAAATVAAIAVGVLQLTPSDKLLSPATETATVSDVPATAAKTDGGSPAPLPNAKTESGAAAPAPNPAPTLRPEDEKRAGSDDRRPNAAAPKVAPPPPSPPPALSAPAAEPRQSAARSPNPFPGVSRTAADAAAPSGQVAPSPPAAPQRSEAARGQPAPPQAPAEPYVPPPSAPQPAQFAPKVSAQAPATPAAASQMAAGLANERPVSEARAKDRKPLPVADWIALIRRLRAEGNQGEAAKELAAFRAAHPDHEKLLPPDLRDWRPAEK
jgi:hypothetical protein